MTSSTHTPRTGASRRLRLRSPWGDARALEAAVADGSWDRGDPRAQRFVARLTSRHSLDRLAGGLRKALSEQPPISPYRVRITGAAADDPTARAACLSLADALEAASQPDPAIVVRTVRFLRDVDSALGGTSARRLAEDAMALRLGLALDRPVNF